MSFLVYADDCNYKNKYYTCVYAFGSVLQAIHTPKHHKKIICQFKRKQIVW